MTISFVLNFLGMSLGAILTVKQTVFHIYVKNKLFP